MAKHVTYPPQGLLPLPGKSTEFDKGCDVWDMIFDAALLVNPAFNIYRIFDTVSALTTVRPPRASYEISLHSSRSYGMY